MKTHMMQQPLLISSLLTYAEQHHGEQLVVSRLQEGGTQRQSYRQVARRARCMAVALGRLGLAQADRVGTLAWNNLRHMELYYAVSGSGLVLHTLNPHLDKDQLCRMIDHAEDQALFFDLSFLPLLESVAARLGTVRHWVLMTDRQHMPPNSGINGLLCFEELLADCETAADGFVWPTLDENSPSALSYVPDANPPKGVLYDHRSCVLHTFAASLPDAYNLSARDCVLAVAPMYRANGAGLPYAVCMVGAKLVLPGAALDGASLYELVEHEGVTLAVGSAYAWSELLAYTDFQERSFSTMRRVVVCDAPCPQELLESLQQRYLVDVLPAWGKAEMSPLGTVCAFKSRHQSASYTRGLAVQAKQGRSMFGVDMRIVDEQGRALPWDGKTPCRLLVRGLWVLQSYFKNEGGNPLVYHDGQTWFPTGDLCTIDIDGFMQIVGRVAGY